MEAINLTKLAKVVLLEHFKMESLFLLKEMLLSGNFMCKIDLKDAYFTFLLSRKSQNYVRFE